MTLLRWLKLLFLGPKVTIPKNRLLPNQNFAVLGNTHRIWVIDAGSNGGEELEIQALKNNYYDIERFGLSFASSPKHADILFVSGPVTRNLHSALKSVYQSVPKPCVVVAVGDGACDGGIWKDAHGVIGAVDQVIPVDLKIPGNPPEPVHILQSLMTLLNAPNR